MTDNIDIGKRLKLARERRGLKSVKEAAAFLNINYQTYAAHENGNRGVVRNLATYAKRYNVSLDWLLAEKGPAPRERAAPDPSLAGWQLAIKDAVQDALEDGQDRHAVASFLSEELATLLAELAHSQGEDIQEIARQVTGSRLSAQEEGNARNSRLPQRRERQ